LMPSTSIYFSPVMCFSSLLSWQWDDRFHAAVRVALRQRRRQGIS
jgi:hypothetical protein